MASSVYVSFVNLFKAAVLTASSAASGYAAENLQEPERIGLPWRSTGTGEQFIVLDLGSAISYDRIGLFGANFADVVFEANPTDSWVTPAWGPIAQTIGYDPERRRYRRQYASAEFTRRFTRVVIPAQTPVDGAAYFELAGFWGGVFTALPCDPVMDHDRGGLDPRIRHEADLGQWAMELETGDYVGQWFYGRRAQINALTPGIGDEYQAWLDLDRQIAAARTFCVVHDHLGTGGVHIVRQTNSPRWNLRRPLAQATDRWDLEEVVTG